MFELLQTKNEGKGKLFFKLLGGQSDVVSDSTIRGRPNPSKCENLPRKSMHYLECHLFG